MISLLQGVPIFAGLDDEALEILLEHTTAQEYLPHDVIVREGETGNMVHLIGSGSVHIFKHYGSTAQVELATLGPNCIASLPRLLLPIELVVLTMFNGAYCFRLSAGSH